MENKIKEILYNICKNNVYKKEYGDFDLIFEEFENDFNSYSIGNKIRIICLDNTLNKEVICDLLPKILENTIKTNLKRLNKSLDLKQIGSKPYQYLTSNLGKGVCNMLFTSFVRQNKYINMQINSDSDSNKVIFKLTQEFFEEYDYSKIIRDLEHREKTFLEISYSDLCSYNVKLDVFIQNSPKDFITLLETIIKYLFNYKLNVGFIDLPASEHLKIGFHRSENLNNLYQFEGIIKRKTDINPKLFRIDYLCTNSDCTYSTDRLLLSQKDDKKKTLKCCPRCKAPVEIVEEHLIDNMFMILEEDFSESNNSDSDLKSIDLMVQGGLIQPIKSKNYKAGQKVKVIGFLEKKEIATKGGAESSNYKFFVNVNNIISSDEDNSIVITKEDEDKIKEFSKSKNIYNKILRNFIPEISGLEDIKSSMILQAIGSNNGIDNIRKDIHILIVGDPGKAKTQLAQHYKKYVAKCIYTSGTNVSKAGLTGACIKDEFTGDWAVEAGSLPKANGGIAIIDELDKMEGDDAKVMHDALESQFIPIRKAIHVDLVCKCGVFSCANPVKGIFDTSKDIVSQINLMPSLLSRFDLTFVLIDKVNKNEDEIVFNHILQSFESKDYSKEKDKDFLEVDFIKKYLFYCKINNNPEFTSISTSLLKEYAHKMRSKCEDSNYKFNARELNALVRLSISYAKLTFKDKVDKECIYFATSLYTRCMKSLGVDFYDSVLAAEYNLLEKNILEYLDFDKDMSFDQLMKLCENANLKYSIKDLEIKINKLKSSGQIVEYKKGKYRRL